MLSPSSSLSSSLPCTFTFSTQVTTPLSKELLISSEFLTDMAHLDVVEGMCVSLSSPPPKCPHCILGKQTHSSVPKLREGVRAGRPLDYVFIDLCGPMSVSSCSGHLYCMNIIDDFSSFIWSLPLCSKADAGPTLHTWLTAIKVQTTHCLCLFVTDNGELATTQIHNFCSECRILHLFTASNIFIAPS